MPFVSVREDFLYQHSTTSSCKDEVVECWYKKSSPGSSKKTAMAHDELLTFVAPSNPHFKVATEKGWTYLAWMAVFSEGRRRQPERNNFEVGGHGGPPAWIYCSIGWLFFMKNPDWNEGHCESLPALLFRTLRTLADSSTEDAKYRGSNLNYKLDKKRFRWYLCGRCSTLGCMLLFCVAGAGLWKYDGCVAWPCHATHMQHTRNTQSTQHATRALFL